MRFPMLPLGVRRCTVDYALRPAGFLDSRPINSCYARNENEKGTPSLDLMSGALLFPVTGNGGSGQVLQRITTE